LRVRALEIPLISRGYIYERLNPRKDCEVELDEHSQERRVDRGLSIFDLVRMVRGGAWRARPDGGYDVRYGKWAIRIKVGQCILHVETVLPDR